MKPVCCTGAPVGEGNCCDRSGGKPEVALNLTELDRLEREMQGKVMSTNVSDIHAQLRPLLDLVDEMGTTLESLIEVAEDGADTDLRGTVLDAEGVLDTYRRAKGS